MMKDKKNIDRLFTERFKDFEATPSPEVWDRIKEKLKEEEDDRKLIPIWWKWAGVAALLVLLITAGKFVFFPDSSTVSTEIVEETPITDPQDNNESIVSNAETGEKQSSSNPATDSQGEAQDSSIDKNFDQTDNALTDTDRSPEKSESIIDDRSERLTTKSNQSTRKAIADTQINELNDPDKNNIGEAADKTTAVAAVSNSQKQANQNTDITTPIETKTKEAVADVNPSQEKLDAQKATSAGAVIADPSMSTEEAVAVEEKTPEDEKPSILDAIEEQNEAIAQNQQQEKKDRWEVTPNLAPVYYNSVASGSSLDPSFADNPQTGDINMSYGVQVGYQIADRLTIRSGVSNVDLGYTTGGVELATGPVSTALRSVDYGDRANVLSAFDRGTIQPARPGDENNPLSNLTPKSTGGNAEVSQNLSYFEVPMELKYELLESRFGISMIGGFSTMILNDNEISVRDGDFRSTIGEANNLNDLSFSTNIGLGFDYKFSKQIRFVVEPMFKYQLNPYSDSSVSFRPYYLGVYSGLSFKF